MREISLDPREFRRFSVPLPLCLAGETQYALGLGAIVFGAQLRVRAEVTETTEECQLRLCPQDARPSPAAEELLVRWRDALVGLARREADEAAGLHVTLELGEAAECCPPEFVLGSPAVAVTLVCVLMAHRTETRTVSAGQVAALAGELLAELSAPHYLHPDRFYAECYVCAHGGALHVAPGAEALNVQLLLPPESLILVVPAATGPAAEPAGWEEPLLRALQKTDGAAELLSATEGDVSPLFEAAAGRLNERETAILYGLLRVRGMISERLEMLGQAFADHDRLAELCDEESAILRDYFAFPAGPLVEVRDRAVECGALGAKLTYAFGGRPALIVLAPGRRSEVQSALKERFREHCVLPVDVDPAGVRSEQQ